jgi:hypothetical protein
VAAVGASTGGEREEEGEEGLGQRRQAALLKSPY